MSNGRNSKGVMVWAILATVFLACSMAANFLLFLILLVGAEGGVSSNLGRESVFREQMIGGDSNTRDKIAVIYLTGIISYSIEGVTGEEGMVGDIKEELRVAENDNNVKGILLVIDSPGGEVTASDNIYRAVARARDSKPVVVSMGSLAASGGYYVAMGGEYVMASESTITGSIGVIMQAINYRKLLDKVGLEILTVKSGRFKDLLNGARENNPEEVKLVQDLIMESYDQFVGIVAKERNMDVDELKDGLADGRVYSGRQAKEEGLIDGLGYFEDAVEKTKELAKIKEAKLVKYTAPVSLRRLLHLLGKSDLKSVKVQVGPESLKLQSGKLYYVAEQFVQ
jgi:protease-4